MLGTPALVRGPYASTPSLARRRAPPSNPRRCSPAKRGADAAAADNDSEYAAASTSAADAACPIVRSAAVGAAQRRSPHVSLDMLAATAARVRIAEGAGTRGAGAVAPPQRLAALEAALGYAFQHRELLELALVHPSASRLANNAALAWAGDAVLQLVVTDQVMGLAAAVGGAEALGWMNAVRQQAVTRVAFGRNGAALDLASCMVWGRDARKSASPSVAASAAVAEAYEAVMAAVYVDGGFAAAEGAHTRLAPLAPHIAHVAAAAAAAAEKAAKKKAVVASQQAAAAAKRMAKVKQAAAVAAKKAAAVAAKKAVAAKRKAAAAAEKKAAADAEAAAAKTARVAADQAKTKAKAAQAAEANAAKCPAYSAAYSAEFSSKKRRG